MSLSEDATPGQPRGLSKEALRTAMRERLKSITVEQRDLGSAMACERFQEQDVWRAAGSILFYAPRPDELDIAPLMEAALKNCRIVALPQYDPEIRAYRACQVRAPLGQMPAGRFGIREPGPEATTLQLNELDLILVPGLAFDEHGHRLGRGRGYYDRLLAGVLATTCGFGFDWQLHPQIPVEPHDILLDCMLTPSRWLDFRPRRHGK